MRIGSRVRLSQHAIEQGIDAQVREKFGLREGRIVLCRGSESYAVLWDGLKHPRGYHKDFLTEVEVEPFPYRSHRTMAQVMKDEQEPQPA